MPMIDAFEFLGVCRTNVSFRLKSYECADADAFRQFVAAAGFRFSDAEFEDALRATELRCRDEYEADEIKQLGQWYRMMAMSAPPSACASCQGKN